MQHFPETEKAHSECRPWIGIMVRESLAQQISLAGLSGDTQTLLNTCLPTLERTAEQVCTSMTSDQGVHYGPYGIDPNELLVIAVTEKQGLVFCLDTVACPLTYKPLSMSVSVGTLWATTAKAIGLGIGQAALVTATLRMGQAGVDKANRQIEEMRCRGETPTLVIAAVCHLKEAATGFVAILGLPPCVEMQMLTPAGTA